MSGSVPLKKFVSETEIEDKRRKRQEEWEKVRQPHQPVEAPEEPVETRSLYEQLQAQKELKQSEYEEQHKLRNQVRGLEKEETDFLDYVVERQQEREREKFKEENDVLQEFRNSVANRTVTAELSTKSDEKSASNKAAAKKRSSQADLLAGAVKRKRSEGVQESKTAGETSTGSDSRDSTAGAASKDADSKTVTASSLPAVGGVARVIGVLPGLGVYTDSENSDTSSSDSEIDTDIFRREQVVHKSGQEASSAASLGHRQR